MQSFIHASLYRSDQHMTAGFSARPTHGGQPVDVIIKDLTVAGCRMLCPVELDERQQWMIDLPGIGMRSCRISRSRRHGIRCEFQTALDFPQIEKARAAHVAAGGCPSHAEGLGRQGDCLNPGLEIGPFAKTAADNPGGHRRMAFLLRSGQAGRRAARIGILTQWRVNGHGRPGTAQGIAARHADMAAHLLSALGSDARALGKY